MKVYEVEVTVQNAQPPKNARVIEKLTFLVKSDCEANAKTHAIMLAEIAQYKQPRLYKNATFACIAPCIREAFTKDKLH